MTTTKEIIDQLIKDKDVASMLELLKFLERVMMRPTTHGAVWDIARGNSKRITKAVLDCVGVGV